jgi:hypothetical protein
VFRKQLKSANNWCQIADMRIRPDDLVVGFPAKQIRKLLRKSVLFLSVDDVTKVLGLRRKSALKLLEDLEQQGFIEKNTSAPDTKKYWKHKIKGGALSNALFSAPVSRRNAERSLSEFMDRVREVNSNCLAASAESAHHTSLGQRPRIIDYSRQGRKG